MPVPVDEAEHQEPLFSFASIGIQCSDNKADKAVQVNTFDDITSLWDNDSKLFTMTGAPTKRILTP